MKERKLKILDLGLELEMTMLKDDRLNNTAFHKKHTLTKRWISRHWVEFSKNSN